MTNGYFKNPKATSSTIDGEGWLYTGDLGYYDDQGNVFVVSRLKELIKYKGFQISPVEVETVILRHPKVADAAVVGIADSTAGEVPVALVVKRDESLEADEIHEYLGELLSKYKQLHGGIMFVETVPKSASGKILRNEMKKIVLSRNSKL